MHRSGATSRHSDDKLHSLIHQVRARWENINLKKSTPSAPVPRLSEVALRGMRLQSQPFSPPVGNQSYYVDGMIDNLLDAIEDSIQQSDNLIVLAGEHNSGKTCSVAQLIHTLYDDTRIFMARGSATQSAEQIVRHMLGIYKSTTPTHVDDCLEQLTGFLADSERTGANNLLVLEDADLLDRRELQLLLNHLDHLNESLNCSIKLLFTSAMPAEQLLSNLHSDQINQGRVEEFRQPLLQEEQIEEYIDARLLMAGSDRELPLSDRAMRLITQSTGGLPGEVDQAAADALNQHFQNSQFKALLSPAHWTAATRKSSKLLAFGTTLLLTGAAMAFFSGNANLDREGTTVREIAIPVNAPAPTELQLLPPPAAEPTSADVTASAKPAPVAATPAPEPAAEPVAAVQPTPAQPAEVAKPEVVAQVEATPVVAAPKPAAPAPVAKPVESTAAAATITTPDSSDFVAGVISGHQWILKRDPKRFTAQMSAGWSERDLRLFATRNGMTNKTAIYRTERDGKGWFSLVHGDFSSPTEAANAIAKLPEVWRKNQPWIRSFASVQNAIK